MKRINLNTQIFMLIIAGSVLFIATSLSSCTLPLSGLPAEGSAPGPTQPPRQVRPLGTEITNTWSAAAYPGFACSADNINIDWDVGDPMCASGSGPSCQTLTVRDDVRLLSTPFTSRELTGSHNIGSPASIASWSGIDPVFTFSVAHDDPSDRGWTDIRTLVDIVHNPPATPTVEAFSLGALCDVVSGQWSLSDYRLDMSSESFINQTRGLGSCVRITSVCYTPGTTATIPYDRINLTFIAPTPIPIPPITLGIDECADGLNLPPDIAYRVTPADQPPGVVRLTGRCRQNFSPTSAPDPLTPAPLTVLEFTFGCDTTLPECGN